MQVGLGDMVHLVGPVALKVLGAVMAPGWAIAQVRRDASIVDTLWPVGLVLLTWATYAETQDRGDEPTRLLSVALVTVWGLRLGLHLIIRHAREGRDRRYAGLAHGGRLGFAGRSAVFVFGLQAALMLVVASPVLAVMASTAATPLGGPGQVALGVAALGVLYQAVADRQLTQFKSDPANADRVMDRGLWRASRHPNYFGELLVWWGLGAAAALSGAPWALSSPLLMTALLLRVSGVTLMERTIGTRRPDYADYVRRTSALIPWWPRR